MNSHVPSKTVSSTGPAADVVITCGPPLGKAPGCDERPLLRGLAGSWIATTPRTMNDGGGAPGSVANTSLVSVKRVGIQIVLVHNANSEDQHWAGRSAGAPGGCRDRTE